MSGPDASWYDMPGSPSTGWLRREPDEPLLEMIVAGLPLPDDAPQHLAALASGLGDLARPAGPGELAGEAAALAAYRATVSPAGVTRTSVSAAAAAAPGGAHTRRSRRVPARARLAAAITFSGIVVSGTAAAYAGVLPAPVQELAHKMIGAPAAHEHSARHSEGQHHAGATNGADRGRNGAHPAAHGKGAHGKAAPGNKTRGKKAHGKTARGKARGHTHPKHPAPSPRASPSPSPSVHTKPPGHGHHPRITGRA